MNTKADKTRSFWTRIVGDVNEFSMENRAFNYVCIITFPVLLYSLLFDLDIAQHMMACVISGLIVILAVLYYYSRFKKQYHSGIVVYAILTYCTLILNFYVNSGILGPTLTLFFLTFHLLISIGKPKFFPLWIGLHIIITAVLLYSQYLHPYWAPYTYLNRSDWFLDVFSCFGVTIGFIFSITNYLRRSYNSERILAEQRARAIRQQNEQIIEQNKMLEKVNEEKDKLFSIISHDLRSPLDSITGYLELVSESHVSVEEKAIFEAELLEKARYTSDLLLNLLTWAKSQMQGASVNLVPIQLREVVDTTAGYKKAFASKKNIKLTYSIDASIEVLCDRDMLLIVMRNLINNAIKFTNEGGEVTVNAHRLDGKVRISVRDTGMGIQPEKYDELFTLKTQSTYGTNNEKGTGLGLMMCRELITLQHGEMWFESTLNEGSVFYISLPLALL
jgi:two-component system sensor histidine kinase/response regulator